MPTDLQRATRPFIDLRLRFARCVVDPCVRTDSVRGVAICRHGVAKPLVLSHARLAPPCVDGGGGPSVLLGGVSDHRDEIVRLRR